MSSRPIPPQQERYADSGQRAVTFYRDKGVRIDLRGHVEPLVSSDRGRYFPATHRITCEFVRGVKTNDIITLDGDDATYTVVSAEDPFAPTLPLSGAGQAAATIPAGQFRSTAVPSVVSEIVPGGSAHPNAGRFLSILAAKS